MLLVTQVRNPYNVLYDLYLDVLEQEIHSYISEGDEMVIFIKDLETKDRHSYWEHSGFSKDPPEECTFPGLVSHLPEGGSGLQTRKVLFTYKFVNNNQQ